MSTGTEPILSPQDVEIVCAALGWTTAPRVEAGPSSVGLAGVLLTPEQGSPVWLQVQRRVGWTGAPLDRQLAAEIVLSLADAPRGPEPMLGLVTLSGGHRAVARPFVDWVSGDHLIQMRPDAHPTLARDLGQVVKQLETVPVRSAALGVDGTRFVATGANVADSVWLRAGQAINLAERAGVAHPRLLDRSRAQLETLLGSLSGPWVLSHGALGPEAMAYHVEAGALRLAGVVGWEDAACCSVARDRARLLDLPAHTLALVLDGYGEGAEAWQSEAALGPIRAWHLVHALERFGRISDAVLSGSDPHASGLVQHACVLLLRALDPSFATERLAEALQERGSEAAVAPTGLRPDPLLANLHRTAIDGARGAHRTADQHRLWVAGLAADLLWLETPEDERSTLVGVGEAAQYARHGLITRRSAPASAPIDDRQAWWERLEQAILGCDDDRAWVMFWCLRDADRALDGALSDAVLRAAEAALWRQSSLGPAWQDDTPAHRAGRAALAAGALKALGQSDEAEEWAYRVQDAVDAIVMDPSAMGQTTVAEIPNLISAMQTSPRRALLAPLLARAIRRIDLPVSWGALAANAEW